MKIRTLLESLDVAFSMYSAIPMPQIEWNERNMKYMMAFFPMVGVVQGALLLGFSLLAQALGLGPILFAAVAALLPLFVTGGIHLDGFCDTVDALSSHQTREKKLEILKDPHTGAFAVMGCVAYLLLTFALWTQPQGSGRWLTVQMMAVGFVLSRSMSALSVVSFPCAKSSGLVHSFSSAAQKRNVRIAATVFAVVCVLLWLWIHPLLGAVLTGCCLLNFWYYYRMSQKQFGGITGDLAGYFLQLNEIIILLASVLYTLSAR
ncbi:MAG: adenosylcobinamide-GDP ribazoletransferase [Negativibacillus sp.]